VALPDDAPSPEQEVGARLQLRRVLDLIAALPPAYRHALEMRRLHGLSQRKLPCILA
jgi:RNA polymerase sigma-70 factor (ECF subfamily)